MTTPSFLDDHTFRVLSRILAALDEAIDRRRVIDRACLAAVPEDLHFAMGEAAGREGAARDALRALLDGAQVTGSS